MTRAVRLRCATGPSSASAPCSSRRARTAFRAKASRAGVSHEASDFRFSIDGATGSTTVKKRISPA